MLSIGNIVSKQQFRNARAALKSSKQMGEVAKSGHAEAASKNKC